MYKGHIKDIAHYLNISPTNVYKTIREAGRKLMEIRIEQEKKQGFILAGFINYLEIENGYLYLQSLPQVKALIKNVRDHYIKFDIRNLFQLSTKYEITLYQYLRNQINIKRHYNFTPSKTNYKFYTFSTTKEEIYKALQIPSTYRWNKVEQRVLKKALSEFSEKTDILFNYHVKKGGRGLKAIQSVTFSVVDLTDQDNLITYIRATVPGNFIYIPGIGWKQIHTISKGIQIDNGILEVDIWRWREILNETRARLGELEQLEKAREERIRLAQERLSQIGRRIKEK
jgi:plasmid replication initiation protein